MDKRVKEKSKIKDLGKAGRLHHKCFDSRIQNEF